MTIEQFRRHKYLPSEWRKLLATNGILQNVLQLMEDNHPARFAIVGDKEDDVSPTRAAIELGLTRGYSKFGDTLKLLAQPVYSQEQIGETSYEAPPQPEKT